jgi:hypothetical protein
MTEYVPTELEIGQVAGRRPTSLLYVDRRTKQWVVRDAEGRYWTLTHVTNAWQHRVPFLPSEETRLEPVPGHYKPVLGIPH